MQAKDTNLVLIVAPDRETRAAAAQVVAGVRAIEATLVQRVESDDAATRAFVRDHAPLYAPITDLELAAATLRDAVAAAKAREPTVRRARRRAGRDLGGSAPRRAAHTPPRGRGEARDPRVRQCRWPHAGRRDQDRVPGDQHRARPRAPGAARRDRGRGARAVSARGGRVRGWGHGHARGAGGAGARGAMPRCSSATTWRSAASGSRL